jgi:FPC/CPF motif-containing protein YcgG
MQEILADLCAHEGFTGAMVTDSSGLPLAVSSSPVASDNLAAFATVLGDALTKAGSYLGQEDASSVSLDINDREKAVLHRFPFEGRPYYLLVLCLQHVEARRELERAIPEIVTTLAAH